MYFSPEKCRVGTYPLPIVDDGVEAFTAGFQDKLILLSPINEGVLECRG